MLLTAACRDPAPEGPLGVAVIGPPARLAPAGNDPPATSAVLLASAAQGLVSLDASGQIEPGLASRWIVSDDGLSYIFRLRRAEWAPGRPVRAEEVARMLRRMTATGGDNPLAAYFSAVDEIDAVTDDIIEIRLARPRPHFLALLATPQLALISRGAGSGPYRLSEREGPTLALVPAVDPQVPEEAQAAYPVALTQRRAAVALVLYERGAVDAVLGGTLADLPVARALGPDAGELRFDPAAGLFGLAVTAREGFLASAENRDAVAMAIDRARIVRLFAVPGWREVAAIVPQRLEMPADPALPEWVPVANAVRLAIARERVTSWRGNNDGAAPRLSVALPEGPGMTLLFRSLALDLSSIGVELTRAPARARADLTLIDAVAPNESATWYLTRLSCARGLPCGETGDTALKASRVAPTLEARAVMLKTADSAYAINMPFIPIASPVRWSLVRPRLTEFRPNARAAHPLHRLLPAR